MPRSRRRWLTLGLALIVTACAQAPRVPTSGGEIRTQWSGRLALKVGCEPVQAFLAAFDLRGNARIGLPQVGVIDADGVVERTHPAPDRSSRGGRGLGI